MLQLGLLLIFAGIILAIFGVPYSGALVLVGVVVIIWGLVVGTIQIGTR